MNLKQEIYNQWLTDEDLPSDLASYEDIDRLLDRYYRIYWRGKFFKNYLRNRKIIHLKYVEDLTYKQIGRLVDLSRERVRQILLSSEREYRTAYLICRKEKSRRLLNLLKREKPFHYTIYTYAHSINAYSQWILQQHEPKYYSNNCLRVLAPPYKPTQPKPKPFLDHQTQMNIIHDYLCVIRTFRLKGKTPHHNDVTFPHPRDAMT